MKYECADCRTPLFIGNAAAWPERCPICLAAPLRVNTLPTPMIGVTRPRYHEPRATDDSSDAVRGDLGMSGSRAEAERRFDLAQKRGEAWHQRAQIAEARCEALKAALREIAAIRPEYVGDAVNAVAFARAALADETEDAC